MATLCSVICLLEPEANRFADFGFLLFPPLCYVLIIFLVGGLSLFINLLTTMERYPALRRGFCEE